MKSANCPTLGAGEGCHTDEGERRTKEKSIPAGIAFSDERITIIPSHFDKDKRKKQSADIFEAMLEIGRSTIDSGRDEREKEHLQRILMARREKVMLTDTLVDIVVDQIRPKLDAALTVVPTKDFAAYRMGVSTLPSLKLTPKVAVMAHLPQRHFVLLTYHKGNFVIWDRAPSRGRWLEIGRGAPGYSPLITEVWKPTATSLL